MEGVPSTCGVILELIPSLGGWCPWCRRECWCCCCCFHIYSHTVSGRQLIYLYYENSYQFNNYLISVGLCTQLCGFTNKENKNKILVPTSVDKKLLHTIYLLSFTDNLGSNLVRVAQHIYNIEMNLLSHILDNWQVARTSSKVRGGLN